MGLSVSTLVIVGLNMADALSRLPFDFGGDVDLVKRHLIEIEAGCLEGQAEGSGPEG